MGEHPQAVNRESACPITSATLLLTVGLVLLYGAFRLGRIVGEGRSPSVRNLIKGLMKMLRLELPTENMDFAPNGGAVDIAPPVGTHLAPEADNSDENEPPRQPAQTTCPTPGAKPVPVNDPAKVAWDQFRETFLARGTHRPFPNLEVGTDVSETEADALLADEELGVAQILKKCRDREIRRQIARCFLEHFPQPASEWADASVLLTATADTTYWVAGDVHARVSAIAKICAVIAHRYRRGASGGRHVLILLGDYIDRGDEPLETLAFIEYLKLQPLFSGFEVITLKGNHDVGLSRTAAGKYQSMVSPAETAEFLQAQVDAGVDISVEADAAMRLAAVSPRLCELTGIDPEDPSRTMLFVHGGVPHIDLQEALYSVRNHIPQQEPFFLSLVGEPIPEALRHKCAEDFTWIRFARDLPVKLPNRGSRGCEIGTEDVSQYLFLHRALTSRDISFVFRGHDHERNGFACYSFHPELNATKKRFAQRECHVLTLNAMEPDHSSGGMFRERDLALAEWSLGGPVMLHRVLTHHLGQPKVSDLVPDADGQPSITLPEEEKLPPAIRPEDLLPEDETAPLADAGVENTSETEMR